MWNSLACSLVLATTAPLVSLALSSSCFAQDRGVTFAGGSVGDGVNAYGGAVVATPGSRLGQGLAVRASAAVGEYRYRTDGQRIEGRYVSGELALVAQTSGEWGWANFSAGPRLSDTRLSPRDPGNRLRGTRVDAVLQTDGVYGQKWRVGWFGSLGVNDRTYITQLRLSHQVNRSHGTRVGLETGIQGDRSYTRAMLGAFSGSRLGRGWEGQLGSGITDQKGRGAQPYLSIGLSKVF